MQRTVQQGRPGYQERDEDQGESREAPARAQPMRPHENAHRERAGGLGRAWLGKHAITVAQRKQARERE